MTVRKWSVFNLMLLLCLLAAWWLATLWLKVFPWWAHLITMGVGALWIGYWLASLAPVYNDQVIRSPRLRYLPAVLLAMGWTLTWGTWKLACRWKDWCLRPTTFRYYRSLAFSWGRHTSPKALLCVECGWAGPLRWMVHTYDDDGCGDVEAVDECPRCGSQDSAPVLMPRSGAWSS